MAQFDCQAATVEQLAEHLLTVHRQAYFKAVTYYANKGNQEMLSKLEQANKLSKILKMQKEYEKEYLL